MDKTLHLPFYAKLTLVLLSLIAMTFIFYVAQDILVPVIMAFLFAILLRPLAQFLTARLHFPNVLASIITVALFVLVIAGVCTFISMKVTEIASDLDKIEKNLAIHLSNIQQFVKENFNLSSKEQEKYINEATNDTMQKSKEIIGSTLMSFTSTLLNMILIPTYTFLILLYRTHFMLFFSKLFKKEHHEKLQEILVEIKGAVKGYIVGLILEMIAVSVLTAIGFMIIGVEYAILLGILTGILNLIPYVGILFAGILSIIASLTGTPDLSIALGVIVVNVIVQLIDNNILVPMIVSSKVQINAFVSIVGIIIGGALAGVAGMFLAIPIIAILKVIFDRIDDLEPWGYLMGDDLPKTYEWRKIRLPLYHYQTTTDTNNTNAEPPASLFTETKTAEEQTNQI